MNNINWVSNIGTLASIISVPLAIYFYIKSSQTTSDKARTDIIKTLSYMLQSRSGLSESDIKSVYNSKLREHKIDRPNFSKNDIVDDLKSEVMSNPFLDNSVRNDFLYSLNILCFYYELPDFLLHNKYFRMLNYFMKTPILYFMISFFCALIFFSLLNCISEIYNNYYYIGEITNFYFYTIIHDIFMLLKSNLLFIVSFIGLLISLSIYIAYKIYIKHIKVELYYSEFTNQNVRL